MAVIIQQTPALCFALVHSTWQRLAGRAGREGRTRQAGPGRQAAQLPLHEGRAVAAAPAAPGAQWGEHSPSTVFPLFSMCFLEWSQAVPTAQKSLVGGSAEAPVKGRGELLQPFFFLIPGSVSVAAAQHSESARS